MAVDARARILPRTRLSPRTRTRVLLRGALGVAIAAVWQWFGTAHPHLMAPFTAVLASGAGLVGTAHFWSSVEVTLLDMLAGFLAACLVGIPLGCVMGLNGLANRIADMYLNWMLAVPELAFIPFFVILFGLGGLTRLVIVFVFAFPVVVQNTRAGIVGVSQTLVEMGRVFEVTRWQMVRSILLPGALPMIMAGARMALARSLLGIVAAGFFVKQAGLGGLIYVFQNNFQLGRMFFGVMAVIAVGLGTSWAIQRLALRVTRWNRDVLTAR